MDAHIKKRPRRQLVRRALFFNIGNQGLVLTASLVGGRYAGNGSSRDTAAILADGGIEILGDLAEARRTVLRDTDAKLSVTQRVLDDGGAGVQVSSVRGRAATIRKRLRQRISDHDGQLQSWQEIGGRLEGLCRVVSDTLRGPINTQGR